jgi:glycosyltransferase involved in cell wall biosynthesis
MKPTTLSLVVPAYNEENTLEPCIRRCVDVLVRPGVALEIIIVDDASTDRTADIAIKLADEISTVRVVRHPINQGKGAAVRTGFSRVTGDIIAIQDADLEYNPEDLLYLMEPICDGRADVVFGSRFISGRERRVLYFWHFIINKVLTTLSNMFTNLNISDMETCYKLCSRDVIEQIHIKENRFGIEPELVAKFAAMSLNGRKLRIYERGISYSGRTYEEGKKIGWKDGLRAIYVILKYGIKLNLIPGFKR